ncbi:hypothetical protein HON01_03325, partial [Candidatus Woesearchaeota archaeon]|nr:hypothetical protein [Candidatus Woesearchaeota archaeon]
MGKRGRNSIGLILVLVILLFIFSISSLVVFGAEIDPEVEQQLESQELVDVIIVLSDNNVPELDSFEEISEDVLADMDESDFARIENEIKDQIELELIDDLNYENIDDRDDDLEGVYDSGDFKSELINSELTDETDEINELEEIEKFEESALPAIKDVLPFKEAIQEEIQKNFQKEIQKEVTEKAVEKYEDQIEERQEVIQENQQEFLSEINTGNVNELSEDQKLIPKQKKQKKSGFGLITGAVVGFFDDESSSETDLYVKRNHTLINSISGKITRE